MAKCGAYNVSLKDRDPIMTPASGSSDEAAEALSLLEQSKATAESDSILDAGSWWIPLLMGFALTCLALNISEEIPPPWGSAVLVVGVLTIWVGNWDARKRRKVELNPHGGFARYRFIVVSTVISMALTLASWALLIFWADARGLDFLPFGAALGWAISTGVLIVHRELVHRRREQLAGR